MGQIVPVERIEKRIFLFRGQKVMLSTDLAELYEVEPRVLIQAVKRNLSRFPEDFMFQLNEPEFAILKSQIVISSWGGARRARSSFEDGPTRNRTWDPPVMSRQLCQLSYGPAHRLIIMVFFRDSISAR